MGSVYLIRQTDLNGEELYKIGITKNPAETRLKCLQTGSPHQLDLLGVYKSPNYKKVEGWLHRAYNAQKLVGEWFELTPQQVINFQEECKTIDRTVSMLLEMNPFYS
jgi:hypothetical protein